MKTVNANSERYPITPARFKGTGQPRKFGRVAFVLNNNSVDKFINEKPRQFL